MCYLAAQMWLFARILPQMIAHMVPRNEDHWLNFLDLLQTVDMLLAPELTEVVNLSTLICDHHHQFKHLYPAASITPKFHYLVHMPRLILE